jgi:serine/threonine protein kinase
MSSIAYDEDKSSEPIIEPVVDSSAKDAEPKAQDQAQIQAHSVSARDHFKSEFSPGDVIESRYIVQSVIGHGGFGCVYKVHQILLKKDFALKTLNPIHATETTILRLRKEAQAASKLDHPNLVRAFDFGMINEIQPFLVMELVEGRTLAEHLKEHGKLAVETALQIFIPMARALAYAHKCGVVHRDLKPSNIMLTTDPSRRGQLVPKIVDFGIAKTQFDENSHALTLTSTGDVFGTPLYMSPEQCAGTGVEARSDIYSLGCMFFEALTGAPPFGGRTALEVMMQHGVAPLPSLKEASLGETFAPQLEGIVERMLAKLPENRYSNAGDVAQDLFHFQEGDFDKLTVSAKEENLTATTTKARKNAIRTAITAFICSIVGGLIGFGIALQCAGPNPQSYSKANEDYDAVPVGLFKKYSDAGYLSELGAHSRRFTFPTAKGRKYGKIQWWDNSTLKTSEAEGVQTIPKDAKLLFSPNSEFLMTPQLASHFRFTDLYGIVLDKYNALAAVNPMSHAVRLFAMQDGLQVFEMTDKAINLRALRSIGDIPHLAWLSLSQILIGDTKMTGANVAELKNLPNLHVLRLQRLVNAGPVLTKLADGSAIRRLSLSHTALSKSDLELISRLKSLEVLSLEGCRGEGFDGNFIDKILKLKRLKVLIIGSSALEKNSFTMLQKLHGLTILTYKDKAELDKDAWKNVLSNLSQCKVIDDEIKFDSEGDYFNSLRENPSPMEI